jgi:hypothetical protein
MSPKVSFTTYLHSKLSFPKQITLGLTAAVATISDCGFASAVAAVAYVNPSWITDIITYTGAYSTATSATFAVHNATTLVAHPQEIDSSELPDNAADKTSVW